MMYGICFFVAQSVLWDDQCPSVSNGNETATFVIRVNQQYLVSFVEGMRFGVKRQVKLHCIPQMLHVWYDYLYLGDF